MSEAESELSQECLTRAAAGDAESWRLLVSHYHDRLRRVVALRLNPRARGRIDPSDVLQEAYLDASGRLRDYVANPGLPFHLWLRQVVCDRLAKLHRTHLDTQMRDAGREVSLDAATPEASSVVLADALVGGGDRPSEAATRDELRRRMQEVLDTLTPADREIIALRHFEQLTTAEVALTLGISEAATAKRYLRALERLRGLLAQVPGGLDAWLR
jgi:RNA polymerase sigma-70 factor (ECF subfamily)